MPALTLLLVSTSAAPARTRARAVHALSVSEAIALARRQRAEARQADIDLARARLGELSAALERVRLKVQTSFSELAQRQNLFAPVDPCASMPPAACPTEAHPFTGSATLTVPVWTGFSIESDVARSHALRRAAEAQRQATRDDIALEVAGDYWELRRAELRRDLLRREIERAEVIAALSLARAEQGIAPAVESNRAHVLVLEQQEQLLSLEGDLARARSTLALALQIDGEVRLSDEPDDALWQPPTLAAAERTALSVRPEIAAAAEAAQAQALTVQSVEGAYWPQVSLFGQATVRNAEFPPVARPTEALVVDLAAGIQLQWVLFDTLATWTAARDADYARMRLEEERPRARTRVLEQVRATHAVLERALERRPVAQKAVDLSRQTLDLLLRRYRVGSALVLELLTAVTDLFTVESDLVDATIAAAEAAWTLRILLGRS